MEILPNHEKSTTRKFPSLKSRIHYICQAGQKTQHA